jgi:glycosyltransferase involved in cell wall biosynthesis
MRFAFISTMHGFSWGGSEELWTQAAARLKESGHDVWASVGYWPQLSENFAALRRQGITLDLHPSNQGGRIRRVWNKLSQKQARDCRRLKHFIPDLVVISQGKNSGGFDWARACRQAGLPYAMIVHCNSDLWWFDEQEIAEAVESYTSARAVFCVSRHNLELLRRQTGEPLENAEIVWNPYNVPSTKPPNWPSPNGIWRLACVARMDPAAKGQDLLIQLFGRPEWQARPIEVSLYGAGPFERSLRRMAATFESAKVHFRGHVADVRGIWEQDQMLVLPSRYEGLPLALVESMWCARPAVVTDVGGNAELCIDGETGFVAPAPTVDALGGALERAWERRNQWPKLGEAARSRAENLIPQNATALFCQRLMDFAVRS